MNLNKLPLFENVDITDIAFTTRKLSKNHTVYNQGDTCDKIDIVLSGTLVAYSLSENGNENIVFSFSKDSVIGANLLFGNVNRYPLNIYCTSDCEILSIKIDEVCRLLNDHSFVMNFVKNISLNSQGMNKKIAMSTGKSLRENILDYFTALSVEQKSNTIILPMSKKQLADHLGVKRPSLFRELKKLKGDGLMDVYNTQIVLQLKK